MKKLVSLFVCLALAVGLALPCVAQELPASAQRTVSTTTEDLGDGWVVVTTVTESAAQARSSTKVGSKHAEYTYEGRHIATVYLNGSFSYDGSSATATGVSASHVTASGWSYGGESTWCSGASVRLTATLSGEGHDVPISLTLTCDKNGNLS
ncbi:MAG: hypothetical protein U0L91_00135 [Gemmiger sp.]|uniref:hypothetical protein n=1 Tax=Gemmiger sp. TaxID=2049027 RepID=UPI002E77BF9C|nr:hypothetical protein [Gemmiger sp.]MEE0799666.1 hypothetical protein [Gemmiger sp.]